MTENEKRVLTLLSKHGPLSKKDISKQGKISWATVVKIVARFEKDGFVHAVGIGDQPETSGKNPMMYELTGKTPLAIGIDVSYSVTHILLTNLKHEVVSHQRYETPEKPDRLQLQEFLLSSCHHFFEHASCKRTVVIGIGIGLPRWLVGQGFTNFAVFADDLERDLHIPVRIEECTARNYTMYKKWVGKAFHLNDFVLMTIRNGIGAGIFYQGHLIRGSRGMAGELGHLTVVEQGLKCRCGKYGCLETLVNQDILYHEYASRIQQNESLPSLAMRDLQVVHDGLNELFSLAAQDHPEALAIIRNSAKYIGMGIALLLMAFDVPHVIITGNFGENGGVIIPYIQHEANTRIISEITSSLSYYPLEELGFAYGAALLILKDYFTVN